MSLETFDKCLRLFRMCYNRNTLRLHNFGEVLMHPRLPEMVAAATAAGIEVSFFTNGVGMDRLPFPAAYWKRLATAGLRTVDFSSHGLSLEEFRTAVDGLISVGRVFDPREKVLGTWAGQCGLAESPTSEPCLFARDSAFVVLWDGRVSSCCLDVEGQRSSLWIDDVLCSGAYGFEPMSLCGSCASMRHYEDL